MCMEAATKCTDQSQVFPGLRMARRVGGRDFLFILGMYTFWRTCNTTFGQVYEY